MTESSELRRSRLHRSWNRQIHWSVFGRPCLRAEGQTPPMPWKMWYIYGELSNFHKGVSQDTMSLFSGFTIPESLLFHFLHYLVQRNVEIGIKKQEKNPTEEEKASTRVRLDLFSIFFPGPRWVKVTVSERKAKTSMPEYHKYLDQERALTMIAPSSCFIGGKIET